MNCIQKLGCYTAAILMLACSGEAREYDDGVETVYEGTEQKLGQAELAYRTQESQGAAASKLWTGAFRNGVSNTESKDVCQSAQSATGTCYVPGNKVVQVRMTNTSCSSTSFSRMTAAVGAVVGELQSVLASTGWLISTTVTELGNVLITCDTSFPGTGNDVYSYARALAGGTSAPDLVESLPGRFVQNTQWTMAVDVTALREHVTTEPDAVKTIRHAVGHMLIKAVGVGRISVLPNFAASPTLVFSGDGARPALSPGQLCRTTKFVTGGLDYTKIDTGNCANN